MRKFVISLYLVCLISFAYAISIPEALNIPDYEVTQEQTTTDALSWIVSGGMARCNYAGYYGASRLSLTAFGPAKISFSWINQTGYGYDGYSFQVDGKTVGTQSHGDWAEFCYDLPAGAHYLTWEWRSSGHKYYSGH